MLRSLGAFIVAPFPTALFQAMMVTLRPKTGTGIFEHPASMFVAICLYFYIVGALLGLPAWLVLRLRSAALGTYVLLGLMVAIAPVAAVLLVGVIRGESSAHILFYDLMLFGLGGAVAGGLFWLIAIRKPQDTDLQGIFS